MESSEASKRALEVQSEWLVPGYPTLTGDVGQAAVNGQVVYYPMVVRSQIDEAIETQTRGLVSFMLLKEHRQTKEGKRIVGFFKLRGNWADEHQATSRAQKIVREQDSKYKVRVAHVGHWIPLVDDDAMALKNINVKVDESAEEAEAKRKAMEDEEEKRKRIMRELEERKQEVENAKDYNDDKESLDYYTMKRVVWMRLQESIELERRKLKNLEEKFSEICGTLSKLDSEHPSHSENWIDNYNVPRKKAGIPDYIPSQMEVEEYARTVTNRAVTENKN